MLPRGFFNRHSAGMQTGLIGESTHSATIITRSLLCYKLCLHRFTFQIYRYYYTRQRTVLYEYLYQLKVFRISFIFCCILSDFQNIYYLRLLTA